MRRRASGRTFVWALLAAAGLSGGCAAPSVIVVATPSPLTVVAGERATVTVNVVLDCVEESSDPCTELSGVPLDYRVVDLPDGASYTIDASLQTPSTPALVRIAFDVPASANAGVDVEHPVRIDAIEAGRHIGSGFLPLRIVSSGPSTSLPAAASVAAGFSHSLAVLADGRVAAWGENSSGQLGFGDTSSRRLPRIVPSLSSIVAISGGPRHSLAVTAGGTVLAWGDNSRAQLGLGSSGSVDDHRLVPQEVPGPTAIVAVSAGVHHSLALASDGTVWAWGENPFVVGAAPPFPRPETPAPVAGLPPIRAIAAGYRHSLAAAEDGSVWIWGVEALGDPSPSVISVARPGQVAGLADIESIATSQDTALALDRQGHVWGWGFNSQGQAGDGTTQPRFVPARIAGLESVVAVGIGDDYAVALTGDGRIWRWGNGAAGESDPGRFVPRQLSSPLDATGIAVGSGHVIAQLRCGQLWAWGGNASGQLGTASGDLAEPAIVRSVGDGAGCATAAVRIRVASDIQPRVSTISSLTPLAWDFVEFTAHVAVGTSVEVTAAPVIPDIAGMTSATTTFAGWAGDCAGTARTISIAVDRTRLCVARYEPTGTVGHVLATLRDHGVITSTGGGVLGPTRIDCGATCEAVFPHGAEVTLSATTPPGFTFERWSVDCSGTTPVTTVVMDRPRTCRANHRALELQVTVTGSGRVTSDPAGIDCGAACVSTPRVGAVTLDARAAEGWQFGGWGGNCSGTSPQSTVTMDADRSCTATFTRIPGVFSLTTVVEGDGTLTSTPAGIACPGDCTAFFPAGTEVDLTAQPGMGGFILGWFDDCAAIGEPTRRVVLNRDLQCRVRFTGLPPYPVAEITTSVGVAGAFPGEIVTINGLGSHVFDPVTGTEDPAGIRNLAWDLDGDGQFDDAFGGRGSAGVVQRVYQTVGDYPVRLRVVGGPFDAAAIVESTISVLPSTRTLVSLSVTKANIGQGTITTTPQGLLECDQACAAVGPIQLRPASTVTLVAAAAPGSTFMGWSGAGCAAATENVTLTLTADTACTATFVPSSGSFPLTVIVNGPASSLARVTALQPPGTIDCGVGGGTCSVTLAAGTPVMMRPDTATLENNLFQGWSGCDTVGTLWLCTVTMNGPRTVVATLRP